MEYDAKTVRGVLKQLGFSKEEIQDKMQEQADLKGWKAITVEELSKMSEKELKQLKSYCWKNGNPRCDSIGITSVSIVSSGPNTSLFDIEWSDGNGDPNLYGYNKSDKIDNIGDGTWNYGLYKKAKK